MYKKHLRVILSLAAMLLLSSCACTHSASSHLRQGTGGQAGQKKLTKPLKVYLLAGQSNMQGKAQDFTIARMALSPESKDLHDKLVDENGTPKIHKNVSAVYYTRGSKDPEMREHKGKLSTGFGVNLGPELAFGVTMDEHVDEPILIIKVAFGGKSIRRDFRPPSACLDPENPAAAYYLRKMTPEEKEKGREEMKTKGAKYYRWMMEQIRHVLADPSKYSDAYDPELGYEIAGFVWFQGFNDLKAPAGYTELMAHFIRDVRKDLDAPKMPFVIGVIGIGGNNDPAENMVALRKEMIATAEIPEFKGNVAAVETAGFWDNEMAAALERQAKANALMDESEDWMLIGKPPHDERIWHYTTFSTLENKTHRPMEEVEGRSSLIEPPGDLKNWLDPDFDTSSWKKGPAPIGKYEGTPKGNSEVEEAAKSFRSPWGEGNMLLMKTTFTLERDDIALMRLWINSTGSYVVYLNGTLIGNYPWVKSFNGRLRRRSKLIDGKLLKKGDNELAVYGDFVKTRNLSIGTLDAYLEGLPKAAADKIQKERDTFFTPRDRELVKGKSHQEYHYFGSAYTYSLIGEAMAKAMIALEKKRD